MRLENSVIDQVQSIANEDHDGNFTAAMESIINQALAMRGVNVVLRWQMYDSVKQHEYERTEKESGQPNVRQLIDALHI